MKQVLENYNNGAVRVADVPAPGVRAGCVLVRTAASLVSIGTEKAMIDIASKSLLGKALARPDWVRQVADKVRSDGVLETYRQARARLDMPMPLGYSAAGVVIGAGAGVNGFSAGDRVACAGHPFAGHAEVLCIPRNLVTPIPNGVPFEEACFAMLGAIALNAVRLAEPTLGERHALVGTGLLGLLSLQMLRAAGCRVLAIDVDPKKLELARELGAEQAVLAGPGVADAAREFSNGNGMDAVLVFASVDSAEPLECAAEIARERGRIVVPGLVKLELPRKVFFEKELRLVVSKAGGPGGTDEDYEVRGRDLPLPYVRWSQGRNLRTFLELIADGRIAVKPLITHRFPIDRAMDAYGILKGTAQTDTRPIGMVLEYAGSAETEAVSSNVILRATRPAQTGDIGVGLIGAGLFMRGVFLPALPKSRGIALRGVATASGVSALHAAESANFEYCTSDYRELLADANVDAVLIATRHDLHGRMVVDALRAGKHVFVEKPLALNEAELREVLDAWSAADEPRILTVGFNRRFAPATAALRAQLGDGPCLMHCRVNAGAIPARSWVHNEEGGGRIIGEACHFIDLIHGLAGGLTRTVTAAAMSGGDDDTLADNVSITLTLDNGSVAQILYAANGDKSFSRERVEVFRGGAVGVIDNFRSYSITRGGRTRTTKAMSLDRGHQAELKAFFDGIRAGVPPVPIEDYAATTRATFAIHEALASAKPAEVAAAFPFEAAACTS